MGITPFRSPGFKLNVRVRDFFVDFLACLIPGFIFLITASIIIIGPVFIGFLHYFYPIGSTEFNNIFRSLHNLVDLFGIKLWIYIGIALISYVVGHLLYRQDPKRPDYRSFLKKRKEVMGYNSWVIAKGDGVIRDDIQFPYSNLKKYLRERNSEALSDAICWTTRLAIEKGDKSRSKSFINQLKTRIHFFYPENTINIIKNEAHIRLASSMWYASKYLIILLYFFSY